MVVAVVGKEAAKEAAKEEVEKVEAVVMEAAMEAMVEVTAEVVGDNILSLMLAVRRMKPLKDRLLGALERLPKILIE